MLKKISEVKAYFIAEIRERELIRKRLSKHIASLDYFDKSLVVYLQQMMEYLLHHLLLFLEHLTKTCKV